MDILVLKILKVIRSEMQEPNLKMVMGVKLAFMWKSDALCAISKPKGH